MQRNEGAQTPYEIYCDNCHTSFAVGTRTCVHCGNRLGRTRRGPTAAGPMPDSYLPEEEEEEAVSLSVARRMGGLGIWILLALGATLMRLCGG